MDALEEYRRVNEYVQPGIDQIQSGVSSLGQGDLSGILSLLGGGFNAATGFVGANIANMTPEFIATQGGVYSSATGRDKLARDIALLLQIGGLAEAPMRAQPQMKNTVVDVPVGRFGNILEGRLPTNPSDITHAYRSMSKAELEAAKKSGLFHAPKNPKFNPNEKWWSPGDDVGQFGRTWKGGDAAEVRIRVPIQKVPDWGPVKYRDVEILNPQTNTYLSIVD